MADKASERKLYRASDAERAFGLNVRNRRMKVELTQEALAELMTELGQPMHQTTVAKIERATRPTSVGEAAALATALGISPAALFADPELLVFLGSVERAVLEAEVSKLNQMREEATRKAAEAEAVAAESEMHHAVAMAVLASARRRLGEIEGSLAVYRQVLAETEGAV